MELSVQLLHICVGFAEVAQDKRMFDDTAALARMKGPKPTLLSDYPQLKIEIQRDGVLLYPSLTHVPKAPLA
jgi:hypothetical protein